MENETLVGICSVLVALAAAYFTYKQSQLALKQYTLSYIEMENNDRELQEAREWLFDTVIDIEKGNDYITSFYSTRAFLKEKKIQGEFKEGKFPEDIDLVNEYIKGRKFIQKIIASRLIASEAIIDGILDEETYWLVRHVDFFQDEQKLKNFILETYRFYKCNRAYSKEAFRQVVKKWRLEPPSRRGVINCLRKDYWSRFQEELQIDKE